VETACGESGKRSLAVVRGPEDGITDLARSLGGLMIFEDDVVIVR